MPKAFRASTLGTSVINGGNIAISSAAFSVGDLVYLIAFAPSAAGVGSPAWSHGTIVDAGANSANTGRLFVNRHIKQAGDGNYTFTGDGAAASSICAMLYGFSAAEHDLSVTPTVATGASTDPNPPAVVPTKGNSGVLAIAGTLVSDTTITVPTNYANLASIDASADTNDGTVMAAWRDGRPASSEDPAAFGTVTTASWRAISLCICEPPNPFNRNHMNSLLAR